MGNKDCSGQSNSRKGEMRTGCLCPYCDSPVEMPYPFCQACQVTLTVCQECKSPVGKEEKVCPHCGARIK